MTDAIKNQTAPVGSDASLCSVLTLPEGCGYKGHDFGASYPYAE